MSKKILVRDISEVHEKIGRVKSKGDEWITDFFMDEKAVCRWIAEGQVRLSETDDAFFLYRDRETHEQLYWGFSSQESMAPALRDELSQAEKKVITDFLSRGEDRFERQALLSCGFQSYMTLSRISMVNPHPKKKSIDPKWFAKPEDLQDIIDILKETMDPGCEQIPDTEELREAIAAQEILVIHDPESGELAAMLMFERRGAWEHWRFWASREKYRQKKLGLQLCQPYIDLTSDVRRHVGWERDNNPVKEIHWFMGFRPDGLKDEVFHYLPKKGA